MVLLADNLGFSGAALAFASNSTEKFSRFSKELVAIFEGWTGRCLIVESKQHPWISTQLTISQPRHSSAHHYQRD